MGGAGVDDAHLGPLRHLDRFARGIVMQAQDREIGRMQRFLAGSAILAAGIVQNDQVELAAATQPVGDFKPVVPAAPSMKRCSSCQFLQLIGGDIADHAAGRFAPGMAARQIEHVKLSALTKSGQTSPPGVLRMVMSPRARCGIGTT
jgi:hypothetical protein